MSANYASSIKGSLRQMGKTFPKQNEYQASMRLPVICEKTGLNKGAWIPEEDAMLSYYIKRHRTWNWGKIPKYAGLNRCGKSCRLRWLNYLRPDLKRGAFSREEEELVVKLHEELGTSWSKIAASLPGRSDNEVKNYWHTHLKKDRSKKTIKPKAVKQKPKSVPRSLSREDTTSIVLESSPFGLLSQENPQGFSLTVCSEVVVADERNPEPEEDIWSKITELGSMMEIGSLQKLHDDDDDVVIITNDEVIQKPNSKFELEQDITSALDFPVSPKSPNDILPLTVEDEVVIMDKPTTNEFATLFEEPNVHWDNYPFLSRELDLAYVLVEAPILGGAWYEYPYTYF